MDNKQYFIQCDAEELAAVFMGLKLTLEHLHNDARETVKDIKMVENLHERIRPDVEAAQSKMVDSNETVS